LYHRLQPGPYSLKVQASGFKLVEKTDLNLSASEVCPQATIILQVGQPDDTISVTAENRDGADREFGTRRLMIQPGQHLTPRGARCLRNCSPPSPAWFYDGAARRLGVQNSPASFSGARGVYSVSNVDGISATRAAAASLDTSVNMILSPK